MWSYHMSSIVFISVHPLGACTRRANVIRFAKHNQSYIPQTPLNSRGIQRFDTWLVSIGHNLQSETWFAWAAGWFYPYHMDPKLRFGTPTPNWHTPLYCFLAPEHWRVQQHSSNMSLLFPYIDWYMYFFIYGGFLKWWYPTTRAFLLQLIILGCFGGTTI